MRLPRPRFTIRRLMVAVVLIAVFLAPAVRFRGWVDRRRHNLMIVAIQHELEEILIDSRGPFHRSGDGPPTLRDPRPAAYHQAMAAKYKWAARHPWLPVWPDPSEPESP